MAMVIEFARSLSDRLGELTNVPARALAATMDGLDEAWVVETFMD